MESKKPARLKPTSKPATAKQKRYMANLATCKTKKEAALKAGYSPTMAAQPVCRIEKPLLRRKEFRELLQTQVPIEKILGVFSKGMDAEKVTRFMGNVYEDADYGERRKNAVEAAKLHGLYVEKHEIGVAKTWESALDSLE